MPGRRSENERKRKAAAQTCYSMTDFETKQPKSVIPENDPISFIPLLRSHGAVGTKWMLKQCKQTTIYTNFKK